MKGGASLPLALLAVLTAGVLAYFIKVGADLPPVVATHFGSGGVANGWSDRVLFVVLNCTLSFILPPFLVACIGILPRIVPVSTLNIPNREYWLDGHHREALFTRMLHAGLWMGTLVQAFLFGVGVLTIRANLVQPPHLDGMATAVLSGAFVLGLALWGWRFVRSFDAPAAV